MSGGCVQGLYTTRRAGIQVTEDSVRVEVVEVESDTRG